MNENLTKYLDAMAGKLSEVEGLIREAAPHVWQAEVTYYSIMGWATFVCIVAGWIVFAGAAALCLIMTRKKGVSSEWAPCAVFFVVVAVVLTMALCVGGGSSLAQIMVPERYAVHSLLEALR